MITHSMGNRGLARAIQPITANASKRSVTLWTAHLGRTRYRGSAVPGSGQLYPLLSGRTTMYVCAPKEVARHHFQTLHGSATPLLGSGFSFLLTCAHNPVEFDTEHKYAHRKTEPIAFDNSPTTHY
jgi:hypothetical protein